MALSGISVNEQVKEAFAQARQYNNVRWLKLRIQDTQVVLERTHPLSGSLANDYDALHDAVEESEPCYFVFRLDTQRDDIQSYEWLLVLFVPDKCKVREKMLYSSTVDGVKRDLGSANFAGDYHVSTKKELKYSDFNWTHKSQRHIHNKDLYTDEELVKKQIIQEEFSTYDTGPTRTGVHGVDFPFKPDADQALRDLAAGNAQLVSLSIDLDSETVSLAQREDSLEADQVGKNLPPTEPRFNFYAFRHEFEGQDHTSIFFIYWCPMKSKVKGRMVYSSSKSTVQLKAAQLGLKIDKAIEISEPEDVSAKILFDWAHPPQTDNIVVYNKPKRPGKGKARVEKSGSPSPSTPQD